MIAFEMKKTRLLTIYRIIFFNQFFNISALLLCMINVLDILMFYFLKIFVESRSTEILIKTNFRLKMDV